MICSAALPIDAVGWDEAALAATVLRLCGRRVERVERWPGGGNNRLYRAATSAGSLALKSYGPTASAQDDRLNREFAALSFLSRCGVEDVPAAVAADPAGRFAVYGWEEGTPPAKDPAGRPISDMDAMIRFIRILRECGTKPEASAIGPAAESCPHAAELLGQIRSRLAALEALSDAPALTAFLAARMIPALENAERRLLELYRAEGLAVDAAPPPGAMILSPSDYGFHNMLRRPDGRLLFLDFEYFGWDDPVKLLADTLWHPAYRLSAAEQTRWLEGLMPPLEGADRTLALRLAACLPLYGLRWSAILLNEFLPKCWLRRLHAGTAAGWEQAKAVQLAKARGWMAEVDRLLALPMTASVADALPLRLPSLTSIV